MGRAELSERKKKFSDELEKLIAQGDLLHMSIQYECTQNEFVEEVEKLHKGDKDRTKKFLERLPSFKSDYQSWYSQAQAVIKQTLPHRYDDFVSYYEFQRVRKEITFDNYMIRDYLQGLRVTRGGGREVVADGSAAVPEFVQQLSILKAAMLSLESVLVDLEAVLQADLFDTEVDSANALAKAGYLRAAGAICGVVLEKHLLHTCGLHSLTPRKKNPGIADLIEALKSGSILTIPQWRFIQHLADIRNICDHAKGREPEKAEIEDLLSGTQKVLKTVF